MVFFPLSRLLSAGSRIRSLDKLDRGMKYHRANLRLIFSFIVGQVTSVNMEYIIRVKL